MAKKKEKITLGYIGLVRCSCGEAHPASFFRKPRKKRRK